MSLIVMKFGGTSVKDRARLMNVAKIVTDCYAQGNDVVAVVSAQGDTTDDLIEKAREISRRPPRREMDMLLATGEQVSAALLAMAIDALGFKAVSLTGRQAGFRTDSAHTNARIRRVDAARIRTELDNNSIVVVTGFQGVDRSDDVTTLGRGGSDTSAVAIAAAMHADVCRIYTDVDGVYTADPRKVRGARKLDEISFSEMLELVSLGAQVLLNRSVELAQKYNVRLEVLSSLTGNPGTIVKEVTAVEGMLIKGVAKDTGFVCVSVLEVPDKSGVAFRMFSLLGAKDVNVDIILQSVSRDGTRDITFTVPADTIDTVRAVLDENLPVIGAGKYSVDEDVAKVSIVGAGMLGHSGVASRMFRALSDIGVNIKMISTSDITISVLVDKKDADRAVQAVHDEFIAEA